MRRKIMIIYIIGILLYSGYKYVQSEAEISSIAEYVMNSEFVAEPITNIEPVAETEKPELVGRDVPEETDRQAGADEGVSKDDEEGAMYFPGTLEEVPEVGYSAVKGETTYICYKDLLILGDTVYEKENEVYEITDKKIEDLLGITYDRYRNDRYKQYRNFIITTVDRNASFLVYDMDTNLSYIYPVHDNGSSLNWYVYDGDIYYHVYHQKGGYEGAVRSINIADGEDRVVFRSEKPGLHLSDFYIRDDGTIFWIWSGEEIDDGEEFWKLQLGTNGEYSETKLCEMERWFDMYGSGFSQYGLIISSGMYLSHEWGGIYPKGSKVVIKDNGEVEILEMERKGAARYLDGGYLIRDLPQPEFWTDPYPWEEIYSDEELMKKAAGITFYDYDGNEGKTYQLIDQSMVKAGFRIKDLFYHDGKITALFSQEDTGELYISQVWTDLERDGGISQKDLGEYTAPATINYVETNLEQQGNKHYRILMQFCYNFDASLCYRVWWKDR